MEIIDKYITLFIHGIYCTIKFKLLYIDHFQKITNSFYKIVSENEVL